MPANGSQLGLSLPSAETPHQEAAQSFASNISSNAWAAVLNVGENNRVETASTASHGNPALDWWDLANVEENSKAWKLMLKAREKLKEYSKSLTLAHLSINSNTSQTRQSTFNYNSELVHHPTKTTWTSFVGG
jgi:hypothetical protein